MTLAEIIAKGGIAVWPLLVLSVLAIATIIERIWFWTSFVLQEKSLLKRIMEAANLNWTLVEKIAIENKNHPIARLVYTPLQLGRPNPEIFHLALEASADDELAKMRKGEKLLEAIVALSPLLGLFGTVWGLIKSLGSIRINDLGTASTSGVTLGIGESLISTAVGLVVAIFSLSFYRFFQALWSNRVRLFRKIGSELEVLYRQKWGEIDDLEPTLGSEEDKFSFNPELSVSQKPYNRMAEPQIKLNPVKPNPIKPPNPAKANPKQTSISKTNPAKMPPRKKFSRKRGSQNTNLPDLSE